jgi:hypothetical protein
MKTIINRISTLTLTLGAVLSSSSALAHHYKVDGIYKMNVKIGERNFVDLLTLKEEPGHKLSGTVTVPGNFTASLTGYYGERRDYSGISDPMIQFTIEAMEHGKKIRVLYNGTIDPRSSDDGIYFTGEAYDLDNLFDRNNPDGNPFGILEAVPLKPVPIKDAQSSFLY